MDKLDGMTLDIENLEKEKLKSVFPQCFVEGKLDISKLLELCGEYDIKDNERYEFTWNGKSECLKNAQTRSLATLRPCEDESKNFNETENLYIEGDNLEVLKLLQTSYYGKVKMIYIDPPYNTGKDFVYKDNYKDSIANYKEITSQATKSNPETMGRFHTDWLNMIYPRLRLSYNLLKDDGVIFISIDDNEVHNLRKVCDEVFGEENFVGQIPYQSRVSIQNDTDLSNNHEYILSYAKVRRRENRRLKESNKDKWFNEKTFAWLPLPLDKSKFANPDNDPRGFWKADPFDAPNVRPNLTYEIVNPNTGEKFLPPKGRHWRTEEKNYIELFNDARIVFGKDGKTKPQLKVFYDEKKMLGSIDNTWFSADKVGTTTNATKELQKLFNGVAYFDTPKPITLIKKLISSALLKDKNDIILDFFSGSATTAHAVMDLNKEDGGNRKFIMVQLPALVDEKTEAYKSGYKNICEIGKERIRRAGEKIEEELKEKSQKIQLGENKEVAMPLDTGFKVFKLDSSCLKIWDNSPVLENEQMQLVERLNDMMDIVKDDRDDLDVVYEIVLKMGIELTEQVCQEDFAGKKGYIIGEDALVIICLEDNIKEEHVLAMAEFEPATIVFAEKSFSNTEDVLNGKLKIDELFKVNRDGVNIGESVTFKFI